MVVIIISDIMLRLVNRIRATSHKGIVGSNILGAWNDDVSGDHAAQTLPLFCLSGCILKDF